MMTKAPVCNSQDVPELSRIYLGRQQMIMKPVRGLQKCVSTVQLVD